MLSKILYTVTWEVNLLDFCTPTSRQKRDFVRAIFNSPFYAGHWQNTFWFKCDDGEPLSEAEAVYCMANNTKKMQLFQTVLMEELANLKK